MLNPFSARFVIEREGEEEREEMGRRRGRGWGGGEKGVGVKGEGRFKLSWTGLKNLEELKRGVIRGSRRRGGGEGGV